MNGTEMRTSELEPGDVPVSEHSTSYGTVKLEWHGVSDGARLMLVASVPDRATLYLYPIVEETEHGGIVAEADGPHHHAATEAVEDIEGVSIRHPGR